MTTEPTIVRIPSSSMNAITPSITTSSASDSSSMMMTNNGIDPEVFAALPPEIQQEILHVASTFSSSTSTTNIAMNSIPTNDSSMGIASSSSSSSAWTCHVCTFVNHPELLQCEICETFASHLHFYDSFPQEEDETEQKDNTRNKSNKDLPSGLTDFYSKLSLRARKALVASTKRSMVTNVEEIEQELSADDLLFAASTRLTQLQSTATQKFQKAKQNLIKIRTIHSHSRKNSMTTIALPSKKACLELAALQKDLNQKCKAGDQVFEALLERLWYGIYNKNTTMSRKSSGWIEIGFQRENPETDFRGGGLLALKCLVYAIETYPIKMHKIFQAQRPSKNKKWYPVCVAGINLTCILAGIFQLGNGLYEKREDCHWKLFEEDETKAFYELFFFAFIKMDAAWKRMNASYMDFGSVLKVTKNIIIHMLQQGPETLKELREISEKTFVDRFVVVSLNKSGNDFLAETENGECPDPYHVLEQNESEVVFPSKAPLYTFTPTLSSSSSPPPAASNVAPLPPVPTQVLLPPKKAAECSPCQVVIS